MSKKTGITITENPKNIGSSHTNFLLTPDELKTVQKSLKEREKQEKKVVKKMFQNNLRKKISKKVVKETPVLNTDSSPSTSSPPQVKKSKKDEEAKKSFISNTASSSPQSLSKEEEKEIRKTMMEREAQEKKVVKKTSVLNTITLPPKANLIIIDNFYNNPYKTRKFILTQEFKVVGNYPGKRTISFANEQLKNNIEKYIKPFGGKITNFPIGEKSSNGNYNYNGSFQYTTSRDRSWFHVDGWNNWGGILYLTPNAPLNSGTGFYEYEDGTRMQDELEIRKNQKILDEHSQDVTKWKLVDKVGNIFNRLILFNSKHYHSSMDYFGTTKEDGRLFQCFFFDTEY